MLTLTEMAAAGYRSLRSIRLPVQRLSVSVGGNGPGKTNLYRALRLVQSAATGSHTADLAGEGGFDAASWAGPRRSGEPVRIRFSVRLDGRPHGPTLEYSVETGLVAPSQAGFASEALVKAESLVRHGGRRSRILLERKGPTARVEDGGGALRPLGGDLLPTETALAAFRDPHVARNSMSSAARWRPGASSTISAPTPPLRCEVPVWPWRRRRFPRTAPIQPPCWRP